MRIAPLTPEFSPVYFADFVRERPVADLSEGQVAQLYGAIDDVLREANERGGRNDEVDLYGRPGAYRRVMHSGAAGQPGPACGTEVVKTQYLGGACYYCPSCRI